MIKFIKEFATDQSGATAIEYGIVLAIVAVGLIISMSQIGNGIVNTLSDTGTSIENTSPEVYTG